VNPVRKPDPPFEVAIFLSKVGQGRTLQTFEAKGVIFWEGQPADALFYIQQGAVRLTVISERGKQAEIGTAKQGDFFGEDCLIGGLGVRGATASAMPECSLMRLDTERVIEVLHDEPEFSALFIRHLLQRNVDIQDALESQLFNHTELRLARTLLLWADFDKPKPTAKLKREFTHAELAEMIGASREKITMFMNKFRDKGYIQYNGVLVVHSSLLNVVLRDQS
jgi:CRP/FNR family transcriptional regulator, cyclic AMP receptor protein